MTQEIYERSPVRVLADHLGGGLPAGKVGFIIARPGVGKSALAVHVALDYLMRDDNVLHVAVRDTVDHVRAFYDEVVRGASRATRGPERATALVAAERHRMILSYASRPLDVEHLAGNVDMLGEVAQFKPDLIVVDGLDPEPASVAALASLARRLSVPMWLTLRPGDAATEIESSLWEHCHLGLRLVPDGRTVKITLLEGGGARSTALPVNLDPNTMLVIGEGGWSHHDSPPSPRTSDCTLYSGGANGAEGAFGAAAEKWGVHEVNFTFEGHKQVRDRGSYTLSPRELAAGDVSLVYVSRRLNRTYSQGSLIRRVLQTLWHMVSRSQQVFVVGTIQDDGTVVGGTGWSVELARMWNKSLWVFDQDKVGWFRWDGHEWVDGMPVIESVHFAGTGTRYLSEEGQEAVDALFERSFSRQLDVP